MITTFYAENQYLVYQAARKLVSYDTIAQAFLAQLASSTSFTNEQKLAIKLAAMTLPNYPNSNNHTFDGPLMGICFMAWEDAGADGVPALTTAEREAIFAGIMSVCKGIINAEAARLSAVSALTTDLPEDWNTPEAE